MPMVRLNVMTLKEPLKMRFRVKALMPVRYSVSTGKIDN
jgi:hypothetical protein